MNSNYFKGKTGNGTFTVKGDIITLNATHITDEYIAVGGRPAPYVMTMKIIDVNTLYDERTEYYFYKMDGTPTYDD
jgi:hypothetical protein